MMSRTRSDSTGALARKGSDGSSLPMTPSEAMAAYGAPGPGRLPTTTKDQPAPLDLGQVLKYSGGGPRGVPAVTSDARQNPDTIYQTIQDNAAKRISSLDYLKKTHEPRVFWFNTLLYTQPDMLKLPSFEPRRLGRRASNFLLLGVSLPSVIDLTTNSPTDYLRALYALLLEYEDYEKAHPVDGPPASLSRARLPSMFKRTPAGKRRTSSAADIGLPMQIGASSSDPAELQALLAAKGGGSMPAGGVSPGGVQTPISIPGGELAAGEDFTWLRTPSIPFEPDFFEVFVTLCDILIECYTRITTLVSSASVCTPETADIFMRADGRIRRVVFEGIIKDFVDYTRARVKNEVAGISKVVLGGLM